MKYFLFVVTSIITFVISFLGIWIIYYHVSLSAVSSKSDPVNFVVEEGNNYYSITNDLLKNNLIKSKYSYRIYLKLHKPSHIKAGVYQLDRNMDVEKIIKTLSGNIKHDLNSVSITFKEGKNMRYIIEQIATNTDNSEEDVKETLKDQEYLKSIIKKYWFIDEEILNGDIYYSLEGYLSPNTYTFRKNISVKEIFNVMLDQMNKELEPYKNDMKKSSYTPHQLITLASIIELEGGTDISDRKGISGVFYNRLKGNWSLGSDVTTYYGAGVDLTERDLTSVELNNENAYNTRVSTMAGKLPVGPICNPSTISIEAALYPTEHDYYYFVSDKTGKTYFTKTDKEHIDKKNELIKARLWYKYE